jgi:chromosome segregation ATPase
MEDCTTAVTSDITELEAHQRQELEKMAEIHRLATEASAKIVEEQREEIATLKAQRQEDLATRAQEQRHAQDKLNAQEAATSELRQESTQTKEDISALRNEMKDLLNSFKAAFPSPRTPPTSEHKRAADIDGNDNNSQSDKRQDVRSTPGKKLFPAQMDIDPTPPQQKLMDGDPQSRKR